jgi:hypothetical protein
MSTAVVANFGQSFIAGTTCWATFVGLSRIIVHFKPATTYYLLLVYAAGLITTTVLFADLNVNGPKPAAISIAWTMAGMATDLPLILIYHIRCSCIFSTSRFRLNILKAVTLLVFLLITSFFSLMLIHSFYVAFSPEGTWKPRFQTMFFPIIDTVMPLYLCISESLFVTQFLKAINGDKRVKNRYKFILLSYTVVRFR